MSVSFAALGKPVTQGSIRSLGKGRPSVHANAARLKPWRATVMDAAQTAMQGRDRFLSAVAVEVTCVFDRPASHYGAKGLRPGAPDYPDNRSSGDADKLARSVLDSLEAAGVIKDDAQVVSLAIRKRYVTNEQPIPCALVTVTELPEGDPRG